ncbi:MAG TPA: efflux RND transporter periplasmic adaptor subunit [Polyangiaceae bacterium]|nr:efflux RND transporter periplasmic adaptor subunit [Polyangiaceae bacterium]
MSRTPPPVPLLLVLLCLCSTTVTCGREAPPANKAAPVQPALLGEESLATVKREDLDTGPLISGSLEPERRAEIVAEASGSVLKLQAELGDTVKRGQVLARIETTGIVDAYRSAKVAESSAQQALDLAQREFERSRSLVESGALPTADLDRARNAVEAAQAQLADTQARTASTQRQVASAVATSPFDGVVSAQSVHEGDVVAPGTRLLTVIDPSSVRLEAQVASSALPALSLGARVSFRVRGYPNQTFTGLIQRIAPAADPVTRQITLLVSIPNPQSQLLSGLFAEGRVASEHRSALVIPTAAVERADQGASVIALRQGKAQRVEIELGLEDEAREIVEVKSGLNEGERVVTGAARKLTPGTPVRELPRPTTRAGTHSESELAQSQGAE